MTANDDEASKSLNTGSLSRTETDGQDSWQALLTAGIKKKKKQKEGTIKIKRKESEKKEKKERQKRL